MPENRGNRDGTLVDDCVQWIAHRIDGRVLRPGMRLPSIRALARQRGVSPFTVREAYDRLVAMGRIEARRRSGFYVRPQPPGNTARYAPSGIDLKWLMHHMLESGDARGPGLGVLPADWLDGAQVAAALRALGRQGRWLDSGRPHGFEPLRALLQQRLAALDIVARPEQIVLTTGITHALNLVLQRLVPSGGTVLVPDPCWFGVLGMLAAHGARARGVSCTARGLDLDALERALREERPHLLVLATAASNPTGVSFADDDVARILELAVRHEVPVFEDDVYADLCASPVTRIAARDGLRQVIHAGSFSKTLAANIRVGFLACAPELAESLSDAKIMGGFTTPELNERLVHKLLVEGHYGRHVQTLRTRLSERRARTRQLLDGHGIDVFGGAGDGLFLWADMGVDTVELAAACRERGLLAAPGALFSPEQAPCTWMRINATTDEADLMALLACRERLVRSCRTAS
ncbi:PLP-dependent aminotransferase family protein [Luteimonas sp. BDR2-5]|uniref:aminotransferase-like domain-containing protein n=1 Tax=Proluteimonas luteida TaxID=2878685 RepID=UPI001E3064A1|nr:PLP-dependent aminotransferase family protein [Luteimonas sp. BDR2-5]MCD9028497.1 PLP-dependent aminotransferase family protein [Luteimonas sp. BDR2-5]